MKIIRNDKLIERNEKIGRYTSLAGLFFLIVVMYTWYTNYNQPLEGTRLYVLLVALLLALVLTQVSMYLGNRFGRRRPDTTLDTALKGIPGEYTLHHYTTPVPHVLTGPAGVWVLLPFHQMGKVIFEKNRWKNFGGGFAQGYMRIFGQEGIGRPDLEAESQIASLQKYFKKNLGEGEAIPEVHAVLVFLASEVEIEAEGTPLPAMRAKNLKEYLRKFAKEQPLTQAQVEMIQTALTKK